MPGELWSLSREELRRGPPRLTLKGFRAAPNWNALYPGGTGVHQQRRKAPRHWMNLNPRRHAQRDQDRASPQVEPRGRGTYQGAQWHHCLDLPQWVRLELEEDLPARGEPEEHPESALSVREKLHLRRLEETWKRAEKGTL